MKNFITKIPSYKSKVCIIFILVITVAISTVVLMNGLNENVSSYYSLLASEYKLPNALGSERNVTSSNINVRLIYVIPSSSQTLVELEVQNSSAGTEINSQDVLLPLRPEINVDLFGFSSKAFSGPSMIKMISGNERVILDLPPLISPNKEATIEIKTLAKQNTSTGVITTIKGPWKFAFTPKAENKQYFGQDLVIDKQFNFANTQITVEKLCLSATETLVYYKILDLDGIVGGSLGQPSLNYSNQTKFSKTKYNIGDDLVVSFPAVPTGVTSLFLTLPRLVTVDGPNTQISIPLTNISKDLAKNVSLDNSALINGIEYQFTELVFSDDSFSLCIETTNENPSSGLFLFSGSEPVSKFVEAVDDKGNKYPISGANSIFNRDTFKLKKQTIEFKGNLSSDASSLNITINHTSLISEPIAFRIAISN